MTPPNDASVLVSVVIPVYNTRPYLADCLDSILAQDLPADEFEIVAVDDGSTDGSGELLDAYAEQHRSVRVIHQENSGWPGGPRNVGLDASRGDYVFFADSDDCLGPQALRRMYDFAVKYGSDVLVPKIVPLEGPSRPDHVWRRTQVDADLTGVIYTLGPWKLFRRRFLAEHGIRFPEGRLRLEDGIFVVEAYLRADRVSLAADYDFYRKRAQPDLGNISSSPVDPDGYADSIGRMIALVRRYGRDPALIDTLVTTLYRRKALKWFSPDRFPDYRPARREAWVQAVRALQEAHVPAHLDDLLPLVHRTRSVLVRHGEGAALLGIAAAQRAGRPLEAVLAGNWLELAVPGLARPALTVAPGYRLVPGEEPAARPSGSVVQRGIRSVGHNLVWPVARRTPAGRRTWAWARRRLQRRNLPLR